MIKKKHMPHCARLLFCCAVLASVETLDAFNFGQCSAAARIGFELVKKMAKVSAIVGGTYWLIRQVLNYRHPRYDIQEYKNLPPAARLVVYTDGKVTVRPSNENTIQVTHKFGASSRTELPQIRVKDNYNAKNKTVTVQGFLGESHIGKFQQFMRWLFRLQPKKTLHHIIKVPRDTDVEITTGNSARYTHNREQPVRVKSVSGNITVHASSGTVLTEDTDQLPKLKVIQRSDPTATNNIATPPAKKIDIGGLRVYEVKGDVKIEKRTLGVPLSQEEQPSPYELEWEGTPHHGNIEIHTPGAAIARNFKGDLRVYGTRNVTAQKDPHNFRGRIFIENAEQDALQVPLHRGSTALNLAAMAGRPVGTLIANGADVNEADKLNRTPLHLACTLQHSTIVHDLLATRDIDVNKQGHEGETPLHAAVLLENNEIIDQLLHAQGIDINKQGQDGETPLHAAAHQVNPAIMHKLLQLEGIDINKSDKKGETPLHAALFHGSPEIVHELLQKENLDINQQDQNGETPLHFAVYRGNPAIVQELLQKEGIDTAIRSNYDKIALQLAQENGHPEIVRILQRNQS